MADTYGVVDAGFVEKTLQDVLEEIEDAEKSAFGAGVDVAADGPLGQLNGIFGDQVAELWELAGAIYRALYPDSAEGEALENVAAITGTTRSEPTSTVVTLDLNLAPGTTVPVGSVVRNSVTGARFTTTTEGANAGADRTTVQVQAVAEETGPVAAPAYSIDQIVSAVGGWVANSAIDSGSAGPFALNFNDTLDIKVDNGDTETLTFAATAGSRTSGSFETFAISDGDTLNVVVDGGAPQTATFNVSAGAITSGASNPIAIGSGSTLVVKVDGGAAQTVTWSTATSNAAQAAAEITSGLTGASAADVGGSVVITSDMIGSDSSVEVTGGTANAALSFPGGVFFGGGFIDDASAALASELLLELNTDIVGATATAVDGKVVITSDTLGSSSSIAITGGTANAVLNFPAGPASGAQDFTSFAAVTASDLATAITSKLTGGSAAALSTSVVRVQSDTNGIGSSLEFVGGTANSATNFPLMRVAGLNFLDQDLLGSDLETDIELRLRRLQELRAQGKATIEAIRAALFLVPGVADVFVDENDTDYISGLGVPPHAVEAIVRAPTATDADLAQAIFDTKAAGIRAFGTTTEVVTDSQNVDHDIGFTRAAEVDIYIEIDLAVNTDAAAGTVYPADGDEQVKAALVAKGAALGIGDDVILEVIKCAAFAVDGVLDVLDFRIDTVSPAVGTTNISIPQRSIADFDISRVVVVIP